MTDKKQVVREFLELLYSGDADGALARAVESPKLLYFNSEVADGFRILAADMPAIYDKPPTRDYTAQYVIGDRVINQISRRSTPASVVRSSAQVGLKMLLREKSRASTSRVKRKQDD